MASEVSSSEKQNFLLQCSICHESKKGRNPKGLRCMHSFCRDCLVGWMKTRGEATRVECPVCRTVTDLPEEGIPGLPVDFRIEEFHDILKSCQDPKVCSACPPKNSLNVATVLCRTCDRRLCDDCQKYHVSCELFSGHEVVPLENVCSDHGKILKYFCLDCFQGMCFKCLLWRKHEKHDVQNLSECAAKVKKAFLSDIEDFRRACADFKRSIAETKANELKKLKDFESTLLSRAEVLIEEDVSMKVREVISRFYCVESEFVEELITEFEEGYLPQDRAWAELHEICDLSNEGMASEISKKRGLLRKAIQDLKNVPKDEYPDPSWPDEYSKLETVDDISTMLDVLNRLVRPLVDKEIGRPVLVFEKTGHENAVGIPSHLEVLPDGSALVSFEGEKCVKRFNTKGKVINYYYTDLGDAGKISFTSDGENVYILCEDESTLVTFNLKTSERTVRDLPVPLDRVCGMVYDEDNKCLIFRDAEGYLRLSLYSWETSECDLQNGVFRTFRFDEGFHIFVCSEDAILVHKSEETLLHSIPYAGEVAGEVNDVAYLGNDIFLMLNSSSQKITRYDLMNECFLDELLSEEDGLSFPFRVACKFPYLWIAGRQSRHVPDEKILGSLQLFMWNKSAVRLETN